MLREATGVFFSIVHLFTSNIDIGLSILEIRYHNINISVNRYYMKKALMKTMGQGNHGALQNERIPNIVDSLDNQ
jgi:hypothetical protein